jgi:hypothetical protein
MPSDGEEFSVLPIIVNWFVHGISMASIQLDGEELLTFTPDPGEPGLQEVSLRLTARAAHRPALHPLPPARAPGPPAFSFRAT